MADAEGPWVFAYGSVVWRPSFPFVVRRSAILRGHSRRFWQASEDHRGVPGAPGRVVTLVESPNALCVGVAYRLDASAANAVLAALDVREQGGYSRTSIAIELSDGACVPAITYVAARGNSLDAGDAPIDEIAQQISLAVGPSGANRDYLLELARALRQIVHPAFGEGALAEHDAHVFALESRVHALSRA